MIPAARLGVAALLAATLSVVAPAPAGAESQAFFNTAPITFSGTTPDGGSPYPSSIQVSGLEGPVTDIDVSVNAINVYSLGDLQLLLVSPSGDAEILKAYHCDDQNGANNFLTFDQQASSKLPTTLACPTGSYKPSNACGASCPFFTSFAGASTANLDNFNGENANGTWRLYAYRTCGFPCPSTGDGVDAGWSLSIDTGPIDVDLPAGSNTFGPASPYPATQVVPLGTDKGLITDLNVRLEGIWHTHPDDLEIMLEKVGGPRVMLMSDACGSFDATAYMWLWDDEAPALMPDDGTTNVCAATAQRPTDRVPGDSLPAPAPAAPYATSLSAFDLVDPRGEWRMWIADDAAGDEGFTTHRFELEYTVRPRAATAWSAPTVTLTEGSAQFLTINRSGAAAYASGAVSVTSAAGSAGPGDFEPISETVTFAAGQTSGTVPVIVHDDAETESAEAFTVMLSSPTGDTRLVAPSTITVTVPPSDETTGGGTDVRAPETSITKAPRATTHKSRTKVKFVADEVGARFECRLDKRRWKPCASPAALRHLAVGRHKFRVRAIDLAGNVEAKAAVVRWRVLR